MRALLRSRVALPIASALAVALLSTLSPGQADAQSPASSVAPSDSVRAVTVAGLVYDSLGAAPLAAAEVQLVAAGDKVRVYSATTDSAGRFTIAHVQPGDYIAGFFHPLLDALGVALSPRRVTVAPSGPAFISLAVPGGASVLPVACGARAPGDSSGAIAGSVHDADTDAPVANAAVVVTWTEIVIDAHGVRTARRRIPVATRDDGSYIICNLPGDAGVLASASARGIETGLVEVHVPVTGIVWRNLTVGDSASVTTAPADSATTTPDRLLRGTARLSGIVRTPDGRPAASARVLVWGTGLTTQTREDGRFTLAGLPPGTFTVEARAIGFEPARIPVDLTNRAPGAVTLTLAKHVQGLAAVTVYGKAPPPTRLDDFLTRREHGMGHYITAADMERRPVFVLSDALRMTPGVYIVPGATGNRIVGRGGCEPAVFLDGMPMYDGATDFDNLVSPMNVGGIEVYNEATTPPQYRTGSCGSVLIWTR